MISLAYKWIEAQEVGANTLLRQNVFNQELIAVITLSSTRHHLNMHNAKPYASHFITSITLPSPSRLTHKLKGRQVSLWRPLSGVTLAKTPVLIAVICLLKDAPPAICGHKAERCRLQRQLWFCLTAVVHHTHTHTHTHTHHSPHSHSYFLLFVIMPLCHPLIQCTMASSIMSPQLRVELGHVHICDLHCTALYSRGVIGNFSHVTGLSAGFSLNQPFTNWMDVHALCICRTANMNSVSLKWPVIGQSLPSQVRFSEAWKRS